MQQQAAGALSPSASLGSAVTCRAATRKRWTSKGICFVQGSSPGRAEHSSSNASPGLMGRAAVMCRSWTRGHLR